MITSRAWSEARSLLHSVLHPTDENIGRVYPVTLSDEVTIYGHSALHAGRPLAGRTRSLPRQRYAHISNWMFAIVSPTFRILPGVFVRLREIELVSLSFRVYHGDFPGFNPQAERLKPDSAQGR